MTGYSIRQPFKTRIGFLAVNIYYTRKHARENNEGWRIPTARDDARRYIRKGWLEFDRPVGKGNRAWKRLEVLTRPQRNVVYWPEMI